MTTQEVYECMKRKKGVRDSEVARAVGVHKNILYEWKSGRSTPRLETIYKVCKYLDTPINVFCELAFEDKTE